MGNCPRPVTKSLLHVVDGVVRRQHTSRTRGHMRAAHVFDPRNLLPGSLGEVCVLQAPESSPISSP